MAAGDGAAGDGAAAWALAVRGGTVERDDAEGTWRIAARGPVIDLGAVPSSMSVVVDLRRALARCVIQWTQAARVELLVPESWETLRLEQIGTPVAQVVVRGVGSQGAGGDLIVADPQAPLECFDVALRLTRVGSLAELRAENVRFLGSCTVERMRLSGELSGTLPQIGSLSLVGDAVVDVPDEFRIDHLESAGDVTLSLRSAGMLAVDKAVGTMKVNLDSATLDIGEHEGPAPLAIAGPGALVVRRRIDRAEFSGAVPPKVDVSRDALLSASGRVILGDVAGGRIRALADRPLDVSLGAESVVRDAVLLGVGLADCGYHDVLVLNEAAKVVPDPRSVHPSSRGWSPNSAGRRPKGRRRPGEDGPHREAEAHRLEELARLVESKGADGAVRTRLWHSAYVARQRAVRGRGEWALLSAYRAMGFGERVGPPLLALTVTLTALTGYIQRQRGAPLVLDEAKAYARAGGAFLEVLAGFPLFVLRLGGSDQPWADLHPAVMPLGRALTAVPLLFCLLAVRRMVRADRKSPG